MATNAVARLVDVCTAFLGAVPRPRAIAGAAAATVLASPVPTVGGLVVTRGSAHLIGGIRSASALVTAVALAWLVLVDRTSPNGWPFGTPARNTSVLRFGEAMMLTGPSVSTLDKLEVVVQGSTLGSRQVALYASASALAPAAMGFSTLFAAFYFPVVSRAATRGTTGSLSAYHWATRGSQSCTHPYSRYLLRVRAPSCPTYHSWPSAPRPKIIRRGRLARRPTMARKPTCTGKLAGRVRVGSA